MSNEDWIDLLRTLETRGDRRCAAYDNQNPSDMQKKKKTVRVAGNEADRKSISGINCKKKNHNPIKGSQMTAIHSRVQRYYVLCKKFFIQIAGKIIKAVINETHFQPLTRPRRI